MNPQTKQALLATGTVLGVVGVLALRTLLHSGAGAGSFAADAIWLGFLAVVTVLGLGLGWWRMYRDRSERRRRPKPLNLG